VYIGRLVVTRSFVLLLVAALGAAQGPYVAVSQRPPRVTVVDPSRFEVTAEIPVDKHPVFALLSPAADTVFVLHNACPIEQRGKSRTTLSIVDLQTRRVRKVVPLSWNVASLSVSDDGRRLIALDLGRSGGRKPKPEDLATVHVIDATTGDDSPIPAGSFARQWAVTRDSSRVFVLSVDKSGHAPVSYGLLEQPRIEVPLCLARRAYVRSAGEVSVHILDAGAARPATVVPLPGDPWDMRLSRDEQWLYVIDEGTPAKKAKDNVDAQLHIVDARNGKLAGTYPLGNFPRWLETDDETGDLLILSHVSYQDHTGKLYRFRGNAQAGVTEAGTDPIELQWVEGLPQPVVVGGSKICPLPADGSPSQPCMDLSPLKISRQEPTLKPFARPPLLEIRYLPRPGMFSLRTGPNGDQLILMDPRAQAQATTLTLGRPEARAHRLAGNIAKDVGIGALAVIVLSGCAYGGCRPLASLPSRPKPPIRDPWGSASSLVGAGGRYLYTANLYTNDLAVVDAESRKVSAYFPLGSAPAGLFFLPGEKYLCAFSQDRIVVLDTATNAAVFQTDVPGGIRQVAVTQGVPRLVVVTRRSLMAWNLDTLKWVGAIEGLSKPVLLTGE
jgi:YVTN family beta-propeller protein